jgi:hypothetical protein
MAFLRHESLPLALRVAKVEHHLSAQEYWFWQEQLQKRNQPEQQRTHAPRPENKENKETKPEA